MPMQRYCPGLIPDAPAISRGAALLFLLAAGLFLNVSVQAQTQGPAEPPGTPPAAAELPPPSTRPGFLDAVGRLFDQSKDAIDSQVRSTQESLGEIHNKATGAAKDAASAAGQAAGSVIALPGARIVTGRQLCPVAGNGAPDCQQGAAVLCRDKGFQNGGRSLDIATSQRCSVRSWLSSKGPKEGDCRIENYVTRAVCQ
jgi:hypothetical protein